MSDQPETPLPSLKPSAVQARWRVPTEFPACPDEFTDDALMLYASRLHFGAIFAENQFSTSLVVHNQLRDDYLIVLTYFAGETIKDWAVAHVSILDGYFLHRSEGTFYSLQGALKHFCELAGEPFGDSIDDYC
jgi:hypothetical protein